MFYQYFPAEPLRWTTQKLHCWYDQHDPVTAVLSLVSPWSFCSPGCLDTGWKFVGRCVQRPGICEKKFKFPLRGPLGPVHARVQCGFLHCIPIALPLLSAAGGQCAKLMTLQMHVANVVRFCPHQPAADHMVQKYHVMRLLCISKSSTCTAFGAVWF